METFERNGFSYIAATPNVAVLIDSTKKNPPPTTAVYVVDPKEKRFPLRIEVGYDIYGDITESYYANCNLPRIDKKIRGRLQRLQKTNDDQFHLYFRPLRGIQVL